METYQVVRAPARPAGTVAVPHSPELAGNKIKLRLHFQGRFVRVEGSPGAFKYTGGEVFNDSISTSCQYSDLCRKLNEKFGDTVSFRYQTPGEDLDPETLVMVTDNDDLQELFEEYSQALSRPNTPHKTFRIKVFVFPALQFETEYSSNSPQTRGLTSAEEELTPCEENFMDASMMAAEDEGPHFESWCTDCDELPSGASSPGPSPSAHPSSDTEVAVHLTNRVPPNVQWLPGDYSVHQYAEPRNAQELVQTRQQQHAAGQAVVGAGRPQFGGGGSPRGLAGRRTSGWVADTWGAAAAPPGTLPHAARARIPPGVPVAPPAAPFGASSAITGQQSAISIAAAAAFVEPASFINVDGALVGGGGDLEAVGGADLIAAADGSLHEWNYDGAGGADGYYDGWRGDGTDYDGYDKPGGYGEEADGTAYDCAVGVEVAAGRGGNGFKDPADMAARLATKDKPVRSGCALRQLEQAQHLDNLALINISESVGRHDFTSGGGAGGLAGAGGTMVGLDGFTEDDFDVPDDPYGDYKHGWEFNGRGRNLVPAGKRGGGIVLAGSGGGEAGSHSRLANASIPAPAAMNAAGRHGSVSLMPPVDKSAGGGADAWADGLFDAATTRAAAPLFKNVLSALPSHISAFGDSVGSDGPKLPSHISAFGDSQVELPEALMLPTRLNADVLAGAPVPPGLPTKPACITQEFQTTSPGPSGMSPSAGINRERGSSSTTPQQLLAQVVTVRRTDVQITKKIGEGAFGEVSQAQVFPYGTVAIKWLKKERFAKYSESFQQEAEVLSQLNHPNIIRMYGLITEPHPAGRTEDLIAGIMTEFVRGGSLSQQLRALNRRLTLRERAHVACQAVLGMAYLHDQQPAIIHFDLKPDNLLVDGQGDALVVKVADFGLSKHKFNSYVSCRDLRGTLPYMAPELVSNPNQVCEKCDVWSMGVVMWEMVALQVPFQDLSAQQILVGLMHGSLHLTVPQDCEPSWQNLIELCVETDPACRPSFRQLAAHLQAILNEQQAVDSGIYSAYS